MSQTVLDRRVQKTLQLLQNALVSLIAEKGYEAVTIQEILDRANVGRSTFYAHFENKDQLLHSIFLKLNDVFEQRNQELLEGKRAFGDHNSRNLTLRLFRFVEENHLLFKAMLGRPSNGTLYKQVYDYLFAQAQQHFNLLVSHEKLDSIQLEMMAHYYVSAFIGVLVWWVENDMPYTAEEIDQQIRQLAIPGARHLLGES